MARPAATARPGFSADSAEMAVLLPLPLSGAYTYRVPPGLGVKPGDFVDVPLMGRAVTGVAWGEPADRIDPAKLKDIADRLDAPPLPESLRAFVDWTAAYTLSPPGAVLRMCMSVSEALEPAMPKIAYMLGGPPPLKMNAARGRVLDLLVEGPPRFARELAEEAAVGPGVVKGLIEAGTLVPVSVAPRPPFRIPDPAYAPPKLSPDQLAAATELQARVRAGFSTTLLEGVTGAGKTEVYFEAMAAAIEQGRQVLVLLPEIALTAQWLDRFQARFGVVPAEWHSDLRRTQKRQVWRAVAEGEARVVIGARSALFLPFSNLGLIVVDEEHDTSFKQEEGVIYNARDMAVVRGKFADASVILVSATPSLETLVNVERGRYVRLHLPERHAKAAMPHVGMIDMRKDPPPPRRFLSPLLVQAMRETLAANEQVMLFLNRRGYAPLTLCGACGHRLECPNCSAWLVEHRLLGRLMCHHCGHQSSIPKECPQCGAEDMLKPCGPGVERLAEEVVAEFPDARTLVMTSDTVTSPRAAADLVARIADHEIDLLIGTQIVAKGFHFPLLTLVGVVDADLGLEGGDLRAGERTHQLLTQVAGRAGRAERPGRVLLQTFMPENPVMQALVSGDSGRFMEEEAKSRAAASMPPFGRLAALIVSGPHVESVQSAAHQLSRAAPHYDGVAVLGPAPAPLSLLRGRHRHRLLLRTARDVDIQAILHAWLDPLKLPNDVRLTVDVDPYSFL